MPEPNEPVLGVPRTDVRLVPFDPRWVELYRIAVSELRDCLGYRMTAVEHIGCTAIPGFDAKPFIDIMVGVASYCPVRCKENYGLYCRALRQPAALPAGSIEG